MTPPREMALAAGLFLATLVSVFFTYGWFWTAGPLTDAAIQRESATFSLALMAILGSHELGHWIVARRHGFSLSLPYFIPFPMAFGTLGAIIRLRSEPDNRTALLEMGAAGPLAGLVVAGICLAVGLPDTQPISNLLADSADGTVMIMGNPPLMDLLGTWVLGAPPGRFDILSPLALAAWVGCLLTCMNLLPIGQLDGGHVARALWPTHADRIGKTVLVLGLLAGVLLWVGWAVWAVLLWSLGAARGLEVPTRPGLTRRARWIAVLAGVAFGLTFMPRPVETDILGVPAAPAEPGVSVP